MTDQEHMDNGHPHLAPADKERLLERLRDGVPVGELAHEFDVPTRMIPAVGSSRSADGSVRSPTVAHSTVSRRPTTTRCGSKRHRHVLPSWAGCREEVESEPYVSVGRWAGTAHTGAS